MVFLRLVSMVFDQNVHEADEGLDGGAHELSLCFWILHHGRKYPRCHLDYYERLFLVLCGSPSVEQKNLVEKLHKAFS